MCGGKTYRCFSPIELVAGESLAHLGGCFRENMVAGGAAVDIGVISVKSLLRSGGFFGVGDDLVYPFGEGEGLRGSGRHIAGGGGNSAGDGGETCHRGEGEGEEVDHC